MGEIADMMLNGDLCEGCGEWIGGDGGGFPRRCSSCRRADSHAPGAHSHEKVACPTCGKRVKSIGLAQHQRDAHGSSQGKSGDSHG